MKRKMTDAERDCRDFVRAAIQNDCDRPMATRLITALVRAVREECAKVADIYVVPRERRFDVMNSKIVSDGIAAAIRGGK